MVVFRDIYIDKFAEMEGFAFKFSNDWRIQTLGTDEESFLFYLEEGTHELTMEVSLGIYGQLISDLQDVIDNLNKIYREILIYTGPSPDPFRDYELANRIPNLVSRFTSELEHAKYIRDINQCIR